MAIKTKNTDRRPSPYEKDDLYEFPDMEAPRASDDKQSRCGFYYVLCLGIGAIVVVSVLIYGSVQRFSDSSDDAANQERSPNLR